MGFFGSFAKAIGLIILLFIVIFILSPFLYALFGLSAPAWCGMYESLMKQFGPGNQVTQFVYFVYQQSQAATVAAQSVFHVNVTGACPYG